MVAVEEVEAQQEDGVVLPSRIKKAQEARRKARSQGAPPLSERICNFQFYNSHAQTAVADPVGERDKEAAAEGVSDACSPEQLFARTRPRAEWMPHEAVPACTATATLRKLPRHSPWSTCSHGH